MFGNFRKNQEFVDNLEFSRLEFVDVAPLRYQGHHANFPTSKKINVMAVLDHLCKFTFDCPNNVVFLFLIIKEVFKIFKLNEITLN